MSSGVFKIWLNWLLIYWIDETEQTIASISWFKLEEFLKKLKETKRINRQTTVNNIPHIKERKLLCTLPGFRKSEPTLFGLPVRTMLNSKAHRIKTRCIRQCVPMWHWLLLPSRTLAANEAIDRPIQKPRTYYTKAARKTRYTWIGGPYRSGTALSFFLTFLVIPAIMRVLVGLCSGGGRRIRMLIQFTARQSMWTML